MGRIRKIEATFRSSDGGWFTNRKKYTHEEENIINIEGLFLICSFKLINHIQKEEWTLEIPKAITEYTDKIIYKNHKLDIKGKTQ